MVRTIRVLFVEVVILILYLKRIRIRSAFRKNSKVKYCIGTIRISLIHEWIERKLGFANICTGPTLDMPSRRKQLIVTLVNIQNDQKHGKLPANLAEEIPWNKLCVDLIGTYVIRKEGKK